MKKLSVAQVTLSLRALDFLDVRSSSCSNLVRLFLTSDARAYARVESSVVTRFPHASLSGGWRSRPHNGPYQGCRRCSALKTPGPTRRPPHPLRRVSKNCRHWAPPWTQACTTPGPPEGKRRMGRKGWPLPLGQVLGEKFIESLVVLSNYRLNLIRPYFTIRVKCKFCVQ